MKRFRFSIFIILIAGFFLSSMAAVCAETKPDQFNISVTVPPHLDNPYKRNVQIAVICGKDILGFTSGIIWDKDHILTVDHLLPANKKLEEIQLFVMFWGLNETATTYEAIVEKRLSQKDGDLLLLKLIKAPEFLKGFQPPKLHQDFILGEKAYIIGNPIPTEGIIPNSIVETRVITVNLDGKYVVLQFQVIAGQSGSGVWSENGELIGLATANFSDVRNTYIRELVLGLVTGPTNIHDFMDPQTEEKK